MCLLRSARCALGGVLGLDLRMPRTIVRVAHPATQDRPLRVEERMPELEIELIDRFKLTLRLETYPWDGLSRANQGSLASERAAGSAQAAYPAGGPALRPQGTHAKAVARLVAVAV